MVRVVLKLNLVDLLASISAVTCWLGQLACETVPKMTYNVQVSLGESISQNTKVHYTISHV